MEREGVREKEEQREEKEGVGDGRNTRYVIRTKPETLTYTIPQPCTHSPGV